LLLDIFIFTQLPFLPSRIFLLHFIYFSSALSVLPLHPHLIQPGVCRKVACLVGDSRFNISVGMSTWDPVYKLVKQIPRGRVTTYGALAKSLRLRGGARTAGRAMAASPSGKGIPWHRVVGAGGKLLIREPHSSLQRKLLESEGVTVLESRVAIKNHLWIPPRPKGAK
jgi:methylated-DNA-protein-cysteine methyltransferase-like protein